MERIIIAALQGIAWFYWILPRRLQVLWGSALGALLNRLKFRKKVVIQNLEYAFPGPEAAEKRKAMLRGSYRHFGNTVLEMLMLMGPLRKFIFKYVDLVGAEHWREAKKQGRGVIYLSSHLGNWEVMAAGGGLIVKSDLVLVTKHLKPEWLHQAIQRGRATCNVGATYEPRTLRDVLSHLKKNGTIGFVLDQYSGPPVGVRVPVFGIPVSTSFAVATVVKRTGAVVLPVANYRKPDGRWVVDIQPPLVWETHSDPQYELAANTAAYASVLEKHIYAHPEQWLWTHRRFKGDLSPLREGEWKEYRARK
jgi:KDO2-lipid IV(A) lauroyltransferase